MADVFTSERIERILGPKFRVFPATADGDHYVIETGESCAVAYVDTNGNVHPVGNIEIAAQISRYLKGTDDTTSNEV